MSSDNHAAPASHAPGHGGHEEEHEEHVNHEAWVIPYADMLTLLMALFLMLWATSNVDKEKFASLSDSLREAFGGCTGEETRVYVSAGSPGLLAGQDSGVEAGDNDSAPKAPSAQELTMSATSPDTAELKNSPAASEALKRELAQDEAEQRENAMLNSVQKRITARAEAEGVLEALQFKREERGLVVTVVADNVLFNSGSASLNPVGQNIIRIVAEELRDVPNEVMVEGHTDTTAIATDRYPSNWELSSHRSTSVLRFMVEVAGANANRIASAGYGQTRPVAPNDTDKGRAANRRVEVVVLSAF